MTTAKILDGKALAEQMRLKIKKEIDATGIKPGLAAILVGDNEASRLYISRKEKAAIETGIIFSKYLCNSECYPFIDEYELLEMITFLNHDPAINGIIVQLPLPKDFDQDKIIKAIDPAKDVDGFNGGKIIPPTISAVIGLLKSTEEKLDDKKTLVIGKSDIFTKGLENYLSTELKLKKIKISPAIPANCNDYDIVIIALGQAHALKKEQVKLGAIIIDIGINKLNAQTVGDVDPAVTEIAGYLSPVPGGVGPLTVACLLRNTLSLAQQ